MTAETLNNMGRTAEILLVEDNYGDVLLTKKAFTNIDQPPNITVAKDGKEAMAILKHESPFEDAPTPDIILLDLNLPKKSGQDVLQEIKADEKLRHIPVVILTSSRAELDVVKSYNMHANSYLIKPVNLENFTEVARTVEKFWFSSVVLSSSDKSEKKL